MGDTTGGDFTSIPNKSHTSLKVKITRGVRRSKLELYWHRGTRACSLYPALRPQGVFLYSRAARTPGAASLRMNAPQALFQFCRGAAHQIDATRMWLTEDAGISPVHTLDGAPDTDQQPC
jgi:hypothetical protein